MDDLVGTMMDAGMTPQQVRETFGELYATDHDPGAPIEPVVRDLLTVARDNREPPGPQVAVPSGVIHSLPDSKDAKVVRVDTEDTYREFRRGGDGDDLDALTAPENAELVPDALSQLAAAEAGLTDTVERGYASQWITGAGRKRRRRVRRHKPSLVGDIMARGAASLESLFDNPVLSPDQTCLLCGVESDCAPVCVGCVGRASQLVGLFERGAASAIHDPNPSARYRQLSTLVGSMYRLQRHLDETTVLGADEEFYRLQQQADELLGVDDEFYSLDRFPGELESLVGDDSGLYALDRFAEEAESLTALSAVPAESIPLSFSQPDAGDHIGAWKQGDNLYASMRLTGWDGQPRILTATTSYPKEVGIVVGYAESAKIPPSQTLAVLDPLARSLGASRLVPRLAAAAPAVLRVSHEKLTPLVLSTMPVTRGRAGR